MVDCMKVACSRSISALCPLHINAYCGADFQRIMGLWAVDFAWVLIFSGLCFLEVGGGFCFGMGTGEGGGGGAEGLQRGWESAV